MFSRTCLAPIVSAATLLVCALAALLLAGPVSAQSANICPAAPAVPPCANSSGPASQAEGSGIDVAVGNPVHALTGAKAQTELDAAPEPGLLGLEIRRHYSSGHADVDSPFGAGWTLSYDTRLYRTSKTAQIIQADGRRIIFTLEGRADAPSCTAMRPEDGELLLSFAVAAGPARKAVPSRRPQPATITGYRWRWPDGREVAFNGDGLLVGIRHDDPDGRSRTLVVTRNAAGLIERVTDPQGRSMQLHHDAAGRISRIDHPRGSWYYRHGPAGGLQSVQAPNGVVRRYEYSDPGHPFRLTAIRLSDPGSATELPVASWSYRSDGRVAEAVIEAAPASIGSSNSSSIGQSTRVSTRGAMRYRFDYEVDGAESTRISTGNGGWLRYRHRTVTGLIRPVSIEAAACSTCPASLRQLDYDSAGRIIRTQWRPAGAAPVKTEIRFERDSLGRVTRIVAPGHDATGKPRWLRRFEYPAGAGRRPILIARPSVAAGREHQLRLTWGESVGGQDRLLRIDEHGYREDEAIARTVHYRHDENGQLAAIDGPLPGEDDLYRVVRDPAPPGRITALLGPDGRPIQGWQSGTLPGLAGWAGLMSMMGLGDPVSSAIAGAPPDPDPALFQISSAEVTYRAANGATTRLVVDDFGRTVAVISDDAGTERIVHDEADRVVLNTDATGASVTISHDVNNRPLQRGVQAPGMAPEVTQYHYEADGTVSIRHPVASETTRRDDQGRLIARTVTLHVGPAAGQQWVRRYHYQGTSRQPSEVDLPDGSQLNWQRSSQPGASRTVQWRQQASASPIDLWQRRSSDKRIHWLLGNGVERALTRDQHGRVARIEDRLGKVIIASRSLSYDASGRIAAVTEPLGGWLYAYDSRGRLIIAQPQATPSVQAPQPGKAVMPALPHPGMTRTAAPAASAVPSDPANTVPPSTAVDHAQAGSWWFAHDDNGNRLLAKAPDQAISAVPDSPDLDPIDVSEVFPRDRPFRFAYGKASDRVLGPAYDAAGRPLRWRGLDLSWHPGGRLASVSRDGRTLARYFYDHRGDRVAKQLGDTWTYFDHDEGRLVAEQRHGEASVRHFVYDGNLPTVMIDTRPAGKGLVGTVAAAVQSWLGESARIRWLHLDHRGAPIATTDARGLPVWTAKLSPDGERLPGSSGPDAEDPRLRLPGQYHDIESGLHDNRHRSYDPGLGRYLSPDPLGLRAGANPYLYAAGDPINKVDPTGLLLFAFDGTANVPDARTNVWLMSQLYDADANGALSNDTGHAYNSAPGIGTTGENQLYNQITADSWPENVQIQFERFASAAATLRPGETLYIDVVGFSRGAIQARVFGEMVAQAVRNGTISNASQVTLRFMGLYDAVATNMFEGMSAEQIRCITQISAEWQHVTHLVAINEHRPMFRPTLLGDQPGSQGLRHEIALIGAHANIGGGYDPTRPPNASRPSDRSDLSDVALWVMLEEARQAGLVFDPLPAELQVVTSPLLNDETGGHDGDYTRIADGTAGAVSLQQIGIAGITYEDARNAGAPGRGLPPWRNPENTVPVGAGPNVAGTINIVTYCTQLVERGLLSRCPP